MHKHKFSRFYIHIILLKSPNDNSPSTGLSVYFLSTCRSGPKWLTQNR